MISFFSSVMLRLAAFCLPLIIIAIPTPPSFPDGTVLAFSRLDGDIYLVDLSQMKETKLTDYSADKSFNAPRAQGPSFSPDGKEIAFRVGAANDEFDCGPIYLMDITGKNLRMLNKDALTFLPVSWSPDGQEIMYQQGCLYGGGTVATIDVDTGEITELRSGLEYPAWSPDGKNFAALYQDITDSNIAMMSFDNPEKMTLIDDDFGHDWGSPSWSPDGNSLVYFGGNETSGNLYIVDLKTQHIQALTHDTDVLNDEPRWSPDGKWIAFESGDYYNRDLYVTDLNDTQRTLVAKYAYTPSWKP